MCKRVKSQLLLLLNDIILQGKQGIHVMVVNALNKHCDIYVDESDDFVIITGLFSLMTILQLSNMSPKIFKACHETNRRMPRKLTFIFLGILVLEGLPYFCTALFLCISFFKKHTDSIY